MRHKVGWTGVLDRKIHIKRFWEELVSCNSICELVLVTSSVWVKRSISPERGMRPALNRQELPHNGGVADLPAVFPRLDSEFNWGGRPVRLLQPDRLELPNLSVR